jgi:hypothetical protein
MHIKIIITEVKPNFLLHMLWSKTSLRNQQTHLEQSWILIYTFMSKNKHKLGNNISNIDKIRVNSPEVLFSITRQYPEVGLKNNYILSYTNHLGRFVNITR